MTSTDWRNLSDERDRLAEGITDEMYAEARAEIDAEVAGYRLAQLRKELGLTQAQLAKGMGVSQARVSEIERGDIAHTELATVSAYIEALGGRMRVVADMGDRTVDVRSLAEIRRSRSKGKKARRTQRRAKQPAA